MPTPRLRVFQRGAYLLMCTMGLAGMSSGCTLSHRPDRIAGDQPSTPTHPAIMNMHEHIQSPQEAGKLLKAMDATGIAHTVLLGSPTETTIGKGGFTGYDQNNADLLTIQATYPDRFSAFCTVNPRDPDKLRKLIGCTRAGSKGLKLYSGHNKFYDLPLTDVEMEPVYAYVEQQRLPIMFHVNLGAYFGEFLAVMKRHPRMIVILPHLGLSSINLDRLDDLLTRYPTLYTDLSFGYDPFLIAALRRMSANPSRYRAFIQKHRTRVLFGTDMVVTRHPRKTVEWLSGVIQCYRQLLETERYRCSLIDGEDLNGLALDPGILHLIYEENPKRLLRSSGQRR